MMSDDAQNGPNMSNGRSQEYSTCRNTVGYIKMSCSDLVIHADEIVHCSKLLTTHPL